MREAGGDPPHGGEAEIDLTITVDGVERRYRLAAPDKPSRRSAPLVLLFHGFSSNPLSFSNLTELPERGASQGFFVATPEGTGGRWQLDAHGSDAAFVDALVAELTDTFCIDLRNVHAAGCRSGRRSVSSPPAPARTRSGRSWP